jgi:hypothetical protein
MKVCANVMSVIYGHTLSSPLRVASYWEHNRNLMEIFDFPLDPQGSPFPWPLFIVWIIMVRTNLFCIKYIVSVMDHDNSTCLLYCKAMRKQVPDDHKLRIYMIATILCNFPQIAIIKKYFHTYIVWIASLLKTSQVQWLPHFHVISLKFEIVSINLKVVAGPRGSHL